MKVSELTGAQLDYWTARAIGVPAEYLTIRRVQRSPDYHVVHAAHEGGVLVGNTVVVLRYSTDWSQGGPLIEKHRPTIRAFAREYECDVEHAGGIETGYGDTALLALCRAVVNAAFGDDVDEAPVAQA